MVLVLVKTKAIVKTKAYATLYLKMKRSYVYFLCSLFSFSFALPSSEAKEQLGRLGFGYNAQFANTNQFNGVPALSVKYGLALRTMLEFVGGFYSGSDGSGVYGLKFMHTLRGESYANFYFLLGLGLVSANQKNGTQFLGGLGTEFFIPGVDSVGISFESGVTAENLTAASGSYVLKTFGVSFIHAGMHYYF